MDHETYLSQQPSAIPSLSLSFSFSLSHLPAHRLSTQGCSRALSLTVLRFTIFSILRASSTLLAAIFYFSLENVNLIERKLNNGYQLLRSAKEGWKKFKPVLFFLIIQIKLLFGMRFFFFLFFSVWNESLHLHWTCKIFIWKHNLHIKNMEMFHKKSQRTFNFYNLTKTNYVVLTCEDLKVQKSSFKEKG